MPSRLRLLLACALLFLLLLDCLVYAMTCEDGTEVTYVRADGARLMEFAPATLKELTLNSCAAACTNNEKGVKCASFEYDSAVQECSLHSSSGQPFGSSVLARTDKGRAFFERVCLPPSLLCPTPYVFERFPQHTLQGHALEVQRVPPGQLSHCLALCLSASHKLNMTCYSVMFFYESGECILNRETRSTAAALFAPVPEGEDVVVDYFENNCHDVACSPSSATLHWLRSETFSIGHDKDVIIESMDDDDCRRLCLENGVAGERFPCRAFVYSSGKKECHLSADSGILPSNKASDSFALSAISSGSYLEKRCLRTRLTCKEASFEVVVNRQLANSTLKTIETASVNVCLEACIDAADSCSSATFNYELDECYLSEESQYTTPSHFMAANSSDYFDKICEYEPPPARALAAISAPPSSDFPTLATPSPALSTLPVDVFPPSVSPIPFPTTQQAENGIFDDPSTRPQKDDHRAIDEAGLDNFLESHSLSSNELMDSMDDSSATVFREQPQQEEQRVHTQMRTECRLSGISLILEFEHPTTGAVFVKESFSSCRTLFTGAASATLEIPFPRSDDPSPRCPGEEIRPDFWSFVVVVQRNALNAPSLMTSSDRIFNVTCDFSSLADDEKLELDSSGGSSEAAGSGRVSMSILRAGAPVSSVALGEEVELRWSIHEKAEGEEPRLGYFVNECVAERIGGPHPQPEPLTLVKDGCPEETVRTRLMRYPIIAVAGGFSTKMKVFRFDGSRRVRVRCMVDVCLEQCPPVLCESGDEDSIEAVQSHGRRRRQSMAELGSMMRRLRPQFDARSLEKEVARKPSKRPGRERSVTIGTLTIVDGEAVQLDSVDKETAQENLPQSVDGALQSRCLDVSSSLCLSRLHALSAASVAVVLLTLQLFLFLKCLRHSWRQRRGVHSAESAASDCAASTSTGLSSSYHHSSVTSSHSPCSSSASSPSSPSPPLLPPRTHHQQLHPSYGYQRNTTDHRRFRMIRPSEDLL